MVFVVGLVGRQCSPLTFECPVQATIPGCYKPEHGKLADAALARMCYACGLSFNLFRYPLFKEAIAAVVAAGKGYLPPSSESVRDRLLKAEVEKVDKDLEGLRVEYSVYGCTICSDGWSSVTRRPLLNVLAVAPKGSEFLCSIDTTGKTKSGEYIGRVLCDAIDKVGHGKVVQVVTDNASNCKLAGEHVSEKYPDIYWTPCAAHCLDLLLEDIGKLPWAKNPLLEAKKVVLFFNRHQEPLAILRSKTDRALLRPAETRFAYFFIISERVLELREHLEDAVSQSRFRTWMNKSAKRKEKAGEVKGVLMQERFWDSLELLVQIGEPIVKVLRLVDSDCPTMGKVYHSMWECQEALKAMDIPNSKQK